MNPTPTVSRPSDPRSAGIPADAPIPLSRLVRVEWSKATDTRSARWLIGLTGLVTVAIMLLPLLRPHSIDQTWHQYLLFAVTGVAVLTPVVSIMTLTTEWTQRTVLTTFTQVPRRGRVMWAKVLVSLLMGVIAVVFAALVCAAAVGIATAAGRHITGDLAVSSVLGCAAFVLIEMLWGVAFGALLHNTAAGVVLFFLVPTIFGIVGAASAWVERWIDPANVFAEVKQGEWSGHGAQMVFCVVLWVALPLTLGLIRTARREIS